MTDFTAIVKTAGNADKGFTFTVTLSNGTTVRRRSTRQYAALAFNPNTSGKGCCTIAATDARRLMATAPASSVVVDLATGTVMKQPGADQRSAVEAPAPRATRTNAQQRAWEKFQNAPARVAKQFRKDAEFYNPERMPERVQSAQHFDNLRNLQNIELQRAELVEALTPEALLELFNAGRRTGGDLQTWAERTIRA